MVANIEGMFHQVQVAPQDCQGLRFLWWPNSVLTEEPVDHQMQVHLFGARSSPSCASFSLRLLIIKANLIPKPFKLSTGISLWMDDCLKFRVHYREGSTKFRPVEGTLA